MKKQILNHTELGTLLRNSSTGEKIQIEKLYNGYQVVVFKDEDIAREIKPKASLYSLERTKKLLETLATKRTEEEILEAEKAKLEAKEQYFF